jgi:hypothetical protein
MRLALCYFELCIFIILFLPLHLNVVTGHRHYQVSPYAIVTVRNTAYSCIGHWTCNHFRTPQMRSVGDTVHSLDTIWTHDLAFNYA